MIKNLLTRYRLVDEFPWPFLVSTASLFLTLGAVLFSDSQFSIDGYIEFCMLNWWGFASKIAGVAKKTVLISVGGYSGQLVNHYGTKPNNFIFNSVVYSPENYNNATIKMLDDLAMAYTQQNQNKIYTIWRIVMCNPDGMFNKNFGKLCNVINAMTIDYNRKISKELKLTEKGFFDYNCIVVNENSFSKDPKDEFNNMIETATMEIANRKAQGQLEYQRNLVESQVEGIVNLGMQSNNDCITILKYDKNTGGIHFCYVDCKKLDEFSFRQKLQDFTDQGFELKSLAGTRAVFGCNLYLVAKDGKDLFLDPKEKLAVLNFINIMAKENPNYFKDLHNSFEYKEFEKTGNLAIFSASVYPVPKVITSVDFRKYLRFKPLDEKEIYGKYSVNEAYIRSTSSFVGDIVDP